jgi:pimeloyl-ACP methyl ester carboxylesterase
VKGRWKVLIGLGVVLIALLAVNTIVVNSETEPAEVTVAGGQIVSLPGGDVQAVETRAERDRGEPPIVLLHCYSCSLEWWDSLLPLLAERHRVIRIDLLGHGGSEKPSSGYSIEGQAQLVAGALSELDVQGAVVVGHSLGFSVATALAEQSSQLVDRAVDIGAAPNGDFGSLPFTARIGYVPVLGEAAWRVSPSFAIKDAYGSAFAPDYGAEAGFADPDRVVEDLRAMTYTSFDQVRTAHDDYASEGPLDSRITSAAIPLLVIFGAEDQLVDDPGAAAEAYTDVPGAQIEIIDGAGHSPNVEKPEETAELIERFAAGATPAARAGPGRRGGAGRGSAG